MGGEDNQQIRVTGGLSYRGVDAVVSFHIGVLPGSVVCFSEGDAWHAAGDGTCIDGHEAAKERLMPWASIGCRSASDDGRVGKGLVEPFDPVVHIVLVDDRLLGCSWSGSGSRLCHGDVKAMRQVLKRSDWGEGGKEREDKLFKAINTTMWEALGPGLHILAEIIFKIYTYTAMLATATPLPFAVSSASVPRVSCNRCTDRVRCFKEKTRLLEI